MSDSSDPLFSMYVKMAEEEDNKMAERWKADADGILIFVSATVVVSHAIPYTLTQHYRLVYSLPL